MNIPVKSNNYRCGAIFLCLMFFITFTILVSAVSVNAKNPTVKQRRNAGKNSKQAKQAKPAISSEPKVKMRAAVVNKRSMATGTAKRQANAKRIGGSGSSVKARKRGSGTTVPTVETASEEKVVETVASTLVENVCPVGVFLKQSYNSNSADYTYYSARQKVCSLPEGDVATVENWVKANKSTYPKALQTRPTWISESETVFLSCAFGYVEKTVDKVKTCVDASTICPLNTIVEKSDAGYINPNTQESCVAPERAVVRNVKGDENTLAYTIADDSAFMFECPANFYAVENSATATRIVCEMCPAGYRSEKGSLLCMSSEAQQVARDASQEEVEEATTSVLEEEQVRLAKLRIKKVDGTDDDYTCINGWTNNWKPDSSGMFSVDFVMNKDGEIKNIVDRNTYGKNKKGCPIKISGASYYTSRTEKRKIGCMGYSSSSGYYERCTVPVVNSSSPNIKMVERCSNWSDWADKQEKVLYTKLGLGKVAMESSDIDDTGVNGWTTKEYELWGGNKPVLMYYFDSEEFEQMRKESLKNGRVALKRDLCVPMGYYFKENLEGRLTEQDLFTYWD